MIAEVPRSRLTLIYCFALAVLSGCSRSSSYGVGPVRLGMTNTEVSDATKGESQVKRSFLPGGSLKHFLTGGWNKGNESILFETSSEDDGLKVIKIDYTLNSADQFAGVVANLTKQYGTPTLKGSSALGGGACTQGTEEEFSYGWGSVRAEDGTIVSADSGQAVVLRGRRNRNVGIILVTITDGPLIRKYFGKDEDKTFQVPAPTDPDDAQRKKLLKSADSLTAYVEAPSWASEDVSVTPSYKVTTTTTSLREYGQPITHPFRFHDTVSVKAVQAAHRPVVLKPPYPTIEDMEASFGKSAEHRKGSASTDSVCYKWLPSKSGWAVLEACFAPTKQDRLVKLTKHSQGNCDDSVTEFIQRDPKDWERINATTERVNN